MVNLKHTSLKSNDTMTF